MNHNLMETNRRLSIVKDILLRKPKGEKGQNPNYSIVEYFCYDACKHKKKVECDHSGWGYSDETLWDLGFRSESDVREYIFRNFYQTDATYAEYYLSSGQRAGVTRKTNRVYGRIRTPLRRVMSSGKIPGLYQVSVGYGSRFYFFGDSAEEVKSLSSTMLRPIYPDQEFTVSFVDRAMPGDILDKNVPSLEKIQRRIDEKRISADRLIEEAKTMEEQAEYVKTLITQNLEVAMRAT